MMGRSPLEDTLGDFDASLDPLAEVEIADAIRRVLNTNPPTDDSERQIALAEHFAFSVMPNYRDEATSWGTYYGPMMTFRAEDSTIHESPSLRSVRPAQINYWTRRYRTARNPVLRARYADLVWDLSRTISGNAPSVDSARAAIDALHDGVAGGRFKYETEAIQRLKRALSLALSIADEQRVATVRDCMMELEDRIAVDDKPGLWGFCFDSLAENERVVLSPKQEARIIGDLEGRLERLSNTGDAATLNPHAAECAAMRLVRYFRRKNDRQRVKAVLTAYRDAYVARAKEAASLVAHAWVKRVYEHLQQSGFPELAATLEEPLRDYGNRAVKDLKPISAKVTIPGEAIDRFVEEMTAGSVGEVLSRIAVHFIPDPEKAKEELLKVAKVAPLQALISLTVVDPKGRPTATIGSVEEDLPGRVALRLGHEMQMDAPFLRMVLGRLADQGRLTVQAILNFLYQAPVFRDERRGLVERGIRALLEGDHAGAAHLLIPQVEAALRELLIMTGGQIYRPGRHGGLHLRALDEILRDPAIKRTLGDRIITFFSLLFTDPRGRNLRNNSMHGFLPFDAYSTVISDRLLQALSVLALIRQEAAYDEKDKASGVDELDRGETNTRSRG